MSDRDDSSGMFLFFAGVLVVALYVWLTWYVGLWLAGGGVALVLTAWAKRRAADGQDGRLGRRAGATFAEALHETMKCLVLGLAVLTGLQLVANAWTWLDGPHGMFDGRVANALWSVEARVAGLRRMLTAVLSPRIAILVLTAAVFLSLARPHWKAVKRVFGLRSWMGRAAKVGLVVASASFFTAEYASLREQGFAQVRLGQLDLSRQLTEQAVHRMAAWEWLRSEIASSTAEDRDNLQTLVKTAHRTAWTTEVVQAEGRRLETAWLGRRPTATAAGARSAGSSDHGKRAPAAAEASPWEQRSSWLELLQGLRGPREPWPSAERVRAAEAVQARAEHRVAELEAAVLELAKLALGNAIPAEMEATLRQVLKTVSDAAAKTVVKQWFAEQGERIKVALREPAAHLRTAALALGLNLGQALRGDPRPPGPAAAQRGEVLGAAAVVTGAASAAIIGRVMATAQQASEARAAEYARSQEMERAWRNTAGHRSGTGLPGGGYHSGPSMHESYSRPSGYRPGGRR